MKKQIATLGPRASQLCVSRMELPRKAKEERAPIFDQSVFLPQHEKCLVPCPWAAWRLFSGVEVASRVLLGVTSQCGQATGQRWAVEVVRWCLATLRCCWHAVQTLLDSGGGRMNWMAYARHCRDLQARPGGTVGRARAPGRCFLARYGALHRQGYEGGAAGDRVHQWPRRAWCRRRAGLLPRSVARSITSMRRSLCRRVLREDISATVAPAFLQTRVRGTPRPHMIPARHLTRRDQLHNGKRQHQEAVEGAVLELALQIAERVVLRQCCAKT